MSLDKSPEKISKMFDNIAKVYDRNNNIISFGTHNIIKKLAVDELDLKDGQKVLDICCGTGDIGKILFNTKHKLDVIGVDFSDNMLQICRHNCEEYTDLIKTDATDLPFENNEFDIITMTFGLRNIQDRKIAIKEAYRILKPNGQMLHLDFGRKNLPSKVFDFISKIGIGLFYGNKLPYEYLINSKNEFPEPDLLIKEFEEENFKLKKRKDFLFGVISAQIYTKII